jgi:benzoyl-CoA reductase subunit C
MTANAATEAAAPLAAMLERCERIVTDLSFETVRSWKQACPDRKAIAYFPVYAPVEIIHAAGMLPVGLAGAGNLLDIQHADARFGSFICSIIKTTMELGLTGHLEIFDGLLFSSICDSARNLCFVMKRNFPTQYIDFLHLPHNSTSAATTDFLAAEYGRLIDNLERMGGIRVTSERLGHSIDLYNQNRALIRELYAMRASTPHLLHAWETYLLIRAGNFLPVEEHTSMLRKALAHIQQRSGKSRDALRVIVEGSFCEQPPLDLVRLLEDAGCYVVDDDFMLGRNWFTADVAHNGNACKSLARAYVSDSRYSSVRHDTARPRHELLGQKVRELKADAVICLIAKFCEPAYFDYVLFKRKLEEMRVPHLLMEFEEKMFTFERARTEVETFVESLMFD